MEFFLSIALAVLKPVALAAGAWVGVRISQFIDSHTENTKVRAAMKEVQEAAGLAVAEVAQSTVDAAKAAAADGKLPAAIAREARDAAIAKTKAIASSKAQAVLKAAGVDVDALALASVESAVRGPPAPPSFVQNALPPGSRIQQLTATP